MKVHYEPLPDVERYISRNATVALEGKELAFERYLRPIRRFKEITPETQILEVGTGTGFFPIICKMKGLRCKGLEISPQLIEAAKETGQSYGVEPDIELGNLEDAALPPDFYDVVIASSVFEHVENWRLGLRRIHETLKPGGVVFFESTNKFSFVSGEYNSIPLYGWMPNAMRYWIRRKIQGEQIMKLGIDFHQFTHSCLRKEFERIGFSRVLDRVQIAEDGYVSSGFRRRVVRVARQFPPAKALALTFAEATRFICVK